MLCFSELTSLSRGQVLPNVSVSVSHSRHLHEVSRVGYHCFSTAGKEIKADRTRRVSGLQGRAKAKTKNSPLHCSRQTWQPPPVFLPGEAHGQRSLMGYNLWGSKKSDRVERLTLTTYRVRSPLLRKHLISFPSCCLYTSCCSLYLFCFILWLCQFNV